jgi:CheY-like chemotaxis protein
MSPVEFGTNVSRVTRHPRHRKAHPRIAISGEGILQVSSKQDDLCTAPLRNPGGEVDHSVIRQGSQPFPNRQGVFTLHEAESTQLHRALTQNRTGDLGASHERGDALPTTPSGRRILLVEDDAMMRDVVVLMLRRLGCLPDVAENGSEGLAAARATPYDLILMDVQMPVMDGIEATRRIRSETRMSRQPTIVALTANATIEDQIVCLQAGMDFFVPKPVRLEALAAAVDGSSLSHQAPSGIRRRGPQQSSAQEGVVDVPSLPFDPPENLPVYDAAPMDALVDELGEEGRRIQQDLIETYLSEGPKTLAAVAEAGLDASGQGLIFVAHRLKAASATLGLLSLAFAARNIEAALEASPQCIDVRDGATRLTAELHRAMSALHLILGAETDPGSSPTA